MPGFLKLSIVKTQLFPLLFNEHKVLSLTPLGDIALPHMQLFTPPKQVSVHHAKQNESMDHMLEVSMKSNFFCMFLIAQSQIHIYM